MSVGQNFCHTRWVSFCYLPVLLQRCLSIFAITPFSYLISLKLIVEVVN